MPVMEILSSRIILRPRDPRRTTRFYRDVLGLAVYREFPGGTVFFLGTGFLEISGTSDTAPTESTQLWLQVRDLTAAAEELADHVIRRPQREPWGLDEMWIVDPDGLRIVLVHIPDGHPLRVDTR
jgi:catechol 2,3-dioxygenase-like lactoylglutathione lyase family enzyme